MEDTEMSPSPGNHGDKTQTEQARLEEHGNPKQRHPGVAVPHQTKLLFSFVPIQGWQHEPPKRGQESK